MSSYGGFARFYDGLTANVEYEARADYILEVFKRLGHSPGLTLDLACGTGSLTLALAKRGVDIYGADASREMLTCALDKAYDEELSILFLCQKMQELDLYGTIDTCVCTLDSINHLTSAKDVLKAFKKVSLFMNMGGYFLFDVNTPYKHKKILADNTFVYDTDEVFCVWQNELTDGSTVKITLDFFSRAENSGLYERCSECFEERAYTHGHICEMLTESGFELAAYYGDMSFSAPAPDEQRVVYIAKKIK